MVMHWPDIINATFEAGGSIVLWLNVRQIWRDKMSRGVHLAPVIFWTVWGGWNLWYYPSLGQWYSFFAGINVLVANGTWLGMMVWYTYRTAWFTIGDAWTVWRYGDWTFMDFARHVGQTLYSLNAYRT